MRTAFPSILTTGPRPADRLVAPFCTINAAWPGDRRLYSVAMTTTAPYGSWASPISVETLTTATVGLVRGAGRRRPALLAGVPCRPGRAHRAVAPPRGRRRGHRGHPGAGVCPEPGARVRRRGVRGPRRPRRLHRVRRRTGLPGRRRHAAAAHHPGRRLPLRGPAPAPGPGAGAGRTRGPQPRRRARQHHRVVGPDRAERRRRYRALRGRGLLQPRRSCRRPAGWPGPSGATRTCRGTPAR